MRAVRRAEPPAQGSARDRLAAAAFELFLRNGFDATTVDDIAEAAGVSRRTFFRHFATKEDVIFPDHDRLRARVAEQLELRRGEPPLTAVHNSVRVVMADYVQHPDISLRRFALTREVTALREREVTSVHAYQRLFFHYLRDRLPDDDDLIIELMAAAVAAAHNTALRSWLRSAGSIDAFAELDRAFAAVTGLFGANGRPPRHGTDTQAGSSAGAVVAVFRSDTPLPQLMEAIEAAAGPPASTSRTRRRGARTR